MVKFGVAASDELKMIGRLLTYKYRHAQGLVSTEFADVVDLLNVSLNGEAYNASHFPNADAVGLLDSRDPERKTVRLCYGTDPELFVIQVIDNLIQTDGNEPLRAWLNGLPGKTPALTCSLNGLYTSQDSRDQGVHVDFPSDRKSKYLTILFNFVCNTDVEGKVGTLTSQKSTVFVDDQRGNAASSSLTGPQDSQEGVAFDGNEKHYGCGSFERLALLIVLNASSRTDENLDTKIAHEMKCNWFKDTQQLSRDRTTAGGVMGKEALVRKMLMPYVTGAGSGRERIKWPRRFCVECLR
jgi:hypothetical protein